MPTRLRDWWNKQVRNRPLRRQLVLLTICLVFSVVLWAIVALNDSYTTTLRFQVDFREVPDDVQITRRPSEPLFVTAEGVGVDLLVSSWPFGKDTIFLPFNSDVQSGFFLSESFRSTVAAFLPKKVLIRGLEPDSLSFGFEKKVSRRVPLISQVELELYPSYQLASAPRLQPDSVTLLGPLGALDTITRWFTREQLIKGLKDRREISVAIIDTVEGISVYPRKATLKVEPRRYTQTLIAVPVRTINVPREEQIRLNSDSIRLTCLVPIQTFDSLQNVMANFEVVVDYRKLQPGNPQIIPDLSFLPPYLKVVVREPFYLEYVRIKSS